MAFYLPDKQFARYKKAKEKGDNKKAKRSLKRLKKITDLVEKIITLK